MPVCMLVLWWIVWCFEKGGYDWAICMVVFKKRQWLGEIYGCFSKGLWFV